MRRHIPGLHSTQQTVESNLDGLFLVRVDKASYQWHPQKPFLALRFIVLEPVISESQFFSGRLYCTRALFGNSSGFFVILLMTQNCWIEIKSMKRPCWACAASFVPPTPP